MAEVIGMILAGVTMAVIAVGWAALSFKVVPVSLIDYIGWGYIVVRTLVACAGALATHWLTVWFIRRLALVVGNMAG